MNTTITSLKRLAFLASTVCAFGVAFAAPASAAVAAHLVASPMIFFGACPAVITFNGKIKSTTQGVVTYKFTRSDGAIAPVQTLTFREPGVQSVSDTWTLGGFPSLPAYAGWEAIQILSPMAVTSNHANFKIRCRAPSHPGH